MINAPQDGDVFNCCGGERESIPLMVTTTMNVNDIDRVLLASHDFVLAESTNGSFFTFRRDLPIANYPLVALVVGKDGFVTESAPINISVQEVARTVLSARMLKVKNQNLIMVSWLEVPRRGRMYRDREITSLGSSETSDTSASGLRFWIEPADTAPMAFFNIRLRF